MEPRRFPAPWTKREIPGGYAVDDADRNRLVYVYADTGGSGISRLPSRDKASAFADLVAALPGIASGTEGWTGALDAWALPWKARDTEGAAVAETRDGVSLAWVYFDGRKDATVPDSEPMTEAEAVRLRNAILALPGKLGLSGA